MKSLIYCVSCFLVLVSTLYSKKEYNTWHLDIDNSFNCISFNGLDGDAFYRKDSFFDLFKRRNSLTISDSTGKPYFCTDGYNYWNRLKEKISISDPECDGMLSWGISSFAFKVPGSEQQYYIITP